MARGGGRDPALRVLSERVSAGDLTEVVRGAVTLIWIAVAGSTAISQARSGARFVSCISFSSCFFLLESDWTLGSRPQPYLSST